MRSLVRERIYYEIAMAIGNSLELSKMLKDGLSTYLRKLNCLAGAVLRQVEGDDGLVSFETVYGIPRRMRTTSEVRAVIDRIPSGLDHKALDIFLDELPEIGGTGRLKHYLMELPNFGLLLLVKSAPGLSRPDLNSLAPINLKLAEACRSCVANERLQDEIRERKRAEEKYRAIFENAIDGIYQTSLDGRFISANPAMARLVGYESPEVMIATVKDIAQELYLRAEDRVRFREKLLRKGSVSDFSFEYRLRDGSRGWGSTSARLVRDENGVPSHIEGVCIDVTARKQALQSLREAKNEAERLSLMKSNFLSMVSHELRTPLTAILGFAKISRKRLAEIIEAECDCPSGVRQKMERINENTGVIVAEGERLTELINNVLDLAKLEAGYFEWHMGETSINEVLYHSLAATGILFEGKVAKLTSDIPPDLPSVDGDRDRLVQVAINLISNAMKFTPDGAVTVSAVEEDGMVVVRVRDTGIGVPEKDRELIFDKFRQLGDTLTDKPKGTGLGLPICKEIVEYHGGRLWLESSGPEGSTFAFSVPVRS